MVKKPDWKTKPIPDKREDLGYTNFFWDADAEKIMFGHKPTDMDDKQRNTETSIKIHAERGECLGFPFQCDSLTHFWPDKIFNWPPDNNCSEAGGL